MSDTSLQIAGRKVDDEIVMPLRQALVSRKIANANPTVKGDGVYNVDVTTLTGLGAATITYQLPNEKDAKDSIKASVSNVKIPVIGKVFEVPRENYEAYKSKGILFDTAAAAEAAVVCAVQEDSLVLQGFTNDGSTYDINGFYQGAGNEYSTSKDFGTYGNATTAVSGAIALCEDDNALPQAWNLILNPTQLGELRSSRSTNGVREMPEILEILNYDKANGPGQILSSKAITAGTGLLSPVDPARTFIELYVVQEYRTSLGVDSKFPDTCPITGAVYGLVYPHIKNSVALSKLSAI